MSIVDWIYPKICFGCGREGKYICETCEQKLVRPPTICPMCCKPSIGGWVHPRCKAKYGIDRLIVGLPYRGTVQQALKKVKYGSAWGVVQNLVEVWTKTLGDRYQIPGDVVITSVPMYARKQRERGFNQAEIVAKLLAKSLSGDSRKVEFGQLLERRRATRPMFGLSKKERKANVRGAFRATNQLTNELTNERTVLVDDVWTTGATCRECTRVLKYRGAGEVWVVTLAR